jgi:hypothetical protein
MMLLGLYLRNPRRISSIIVVVMKMAKKSNEPDYGEDKDQLKEEQEERSRETLC